MCYAMKSSAKRVDSSYWVSMGKYSYVNLVVSELLWNHFQHLWIIHGYWVSIGKYR